MTRICMIGNSHLGALKQALSDGPIAGIPEEISFDTFGSVRSTLQDVRFAGSRIVPNRKVVRQAFRRTGGRGEIELSEYDGVILTCRNSPFFVRAYLSGDQVAPLSPAAVRAVHESFLDDWSIDLALGIAKVIAPRPVWFLGRPFNAAHDFHARKVLATLNDPETGPDAQLRLADIYQCLAEVVEDTHPAENLIFYRPPEHVLEPFGLFTKSEYSRNGRKLAKQMQSDQAVPKKEEEDTMHMNGDYGAQILGDILGQRNADAWNVA